MADDLIGEKLGGNTILALLGQGAMARVYRARQDWPPREVALKVIRRIPGDTTDSAARFQREKEILQKLVHPHILPIYEFAANSDYLWIASLLVEGGTLEGPLQAGPLPLAEVARIVRQLGGAVDLADAQGVIHRDIKPANVMIEPRPEGPHYILCDFGVAKLIEGEGLTAPGVTLGTPEYMSPEQVTGKPLGAPSDQYSLGIMVYQLLTGRLPFTGKLMAVMEAHARSAPPPLGNALPPAVGEVVLKALAKDPAQRHASSEAFGLALEAAAGVVVDLPEGNTLAVPRMRPAEPVPDLPAGMTVAVAKLGAPIVADLPPGSTVTVAQLSDRPVVEDLPPGGTVTVQALSEGVVDLPEGGTMMVPALPSQPPAFAFPPPPPPPAKRRKLDWRLVAAVALPCLLALPFLLRHPSKMVPLVYCLRAGDNPPEVFQRDAAGTVRSLGTGRSARLSPDGKSLLVTAGEELVRVDLSSGTRQTLAHLGSPDLNGTLAPDGKSVVFAAMRDRRPQLLRMEIPNGKPKSLGLGKGRFQAPDFSPNGENLAYASDAENGMSIWVLQLKTKKKRRLTHPEKGAVDTFPAWSPNGQSLVFERQQGAVRQLQIVRLDGTEEAGPLASPGGQPRWSPSSDIAYVGDHGLWRLTPSHGKPALLMADPSGNDQELLSPVWLQP